MKLRIALILSLSLTRMADADRDPRPLQAAEQQTFFPLACKRVIAHDENHTCAAMRDYGDGTPTDLSLDAVAYGAFTKAGADEAYVTYASSSEPHASNFGGGILFARKVGAWKLVRWYSGGQMNHCVALPAESMQRLLCLSGWMGQGEVDSSVWLKRVAATNEQDTIAKAETAILKAQDDREAGMPGQPNAYQCEMKRGPDEAILFSIDSLKRSTAPGVLAESTVTYAMARDVAAACRAKSLADVKETKGTVRYRLVGGTVIADMPAKFAKTDY
ncbi:MAG TPA: hypothetical protein VGG48_14795 [Rhizomicrobium sp.]